mgnify:CR=1 FL=1
MNFLFVSNDFSAFLAHRHWLAKSLLEKGHTVSLCTGGIEAGEQALMDERISLIASHLAPHRLEIGTDLKLIQQYKSLIQSVKPDIVHTFTAKPNLYMTLALLSLKRQSKHLPSLVMSFPGLGKIFEPSTEFRSKARRRLASSVLRRASRNLNCRATFENLRDRDYFIRENIFRDNQCALKLAGIFSIDTEISR